MNCGVSVCCGVDVDIFRMTDICLTYETERSGEKNYARQRVMRAIDRNERSMRETKDQLRTGE